ncbi:hypothetical protein TrVE_jg1271 [Triparma verrucosa]|uniref:Uncharacterized protein n=1 Tax=Triparma verrucosa TaxID=1606542 RepID=A0A9W7BUZ7_9STRA|nr:hypothetical protein TrVE_jg1271 [Triparma verrucosa]
MTHLFHHLSQNPPHKFLSSLSPTTVPDSSAAPSLTSFPPSSAGASSLTDQTGLLPSTSTAISVSDQNITESGFFLTPAKLGGADAIKEMLKELEDSKGNAKPKSKNPTYGTVFKHGKLSFEYIYVNVEGVEVNITASMLGMLEREYHLRCWTSADRQAEKWYNWIICSPEDDKPVENKTLMNDMKASPINYRLLAIRNMDDMKYAKGKQHPKHTLMNVNMKLTVLYPSKVNNVLEIFQITPSTSKKQCNREGCSALFDSWDACNNNWQNCCKACKGNLTKVRSAEQRLTPIGIATVFASNAHAKDQEAGEKNILSKPAMFEKFLPLVEAAHGTFGNDTILSKERRLAALNPDHNSYSNNLRENKVVLVPFRFNMGGASTTETPRMESRQKCIRSPPSSSSPASRRFSR